MPALNDDAGSMATRTLMSLLRWLANRWRYRNMGAGGRDARGGELPRDVRMLNEDMQTVSLLRPGQRLVPISFSDRSHSKDVAHRFATLLSRNGYEDVFLSRDRKNVIIPEAILEDAMRLAKREGILHFQRDPLERQAVTISCPSPARSQEVLAALAKDNWDPQPHPDDPTRIVLLASEEEMGYLTRALERVGADSDCALESSPLDPEVATGDQRDFAQEHSLEVQQDDATRVLGLRMKAFEQVVAERGDELPEDLRARCQEAARDASEALESGSDVSVRLAAKQLDELGPQLASAAYGAKTAAREAGTKEVAADGEWHQVDVADRNAPAQGPSDVVDEPGGEGDRGPAEEAAHDGNPPLDVQRAEAESYLASQGGRDAIDLGEHTRGEEVR